LKTQNLWILAATEMRSCRRLARTWVFVWVAYIVCTGWYIGIVAESSWASVPGNWTFDSVNPQYSIATLMNVFVAIFSFGIIFLAFDIRARDVQSRIREVIDKQAVTNVEIVFGRVVGIVLLLLIFCLVFLAILASYESITGLVGYPHRIGIQPISVMSLFVWNIFPNLVFFGALVAFLVTLVRMRLVVATMAVGVFTGFFWLANHIPVRLQESLSPFLASALLPSDLAPIFATPAIVVSKCTMLITSVALLIFAASILRRTDPRRRENVILGISASTISVFVVVGLVFAVYAAQHQKNEWIAVHQQQSRSAFPDVQSLTGNIELRPGREISLDISLTVHTPTENTTDSVVFSLNPGYTIHSLFVDGKETANFSFQLGVLKIPSELLPQLSHEIRVKATGKPNDRFAYLDQARDFQKLTHHGVRSLGLRNSIFHHDFVALMPGIVWYPISGAAINRDILETHSRDVFQTDLTVTVPKNWQVVTVGNRKAIENQNRSIFQFQSNAPLPELVLIASRFEERATTIEGVVFEVLLSQKHRNNLDVLAPITDKIHEWVAERIKAARSLFLDYPYGAFYVVEVPSNLRIYGGGWRMDSVLQPPGMMLLRETAFPTAPFETYFRQANMRASGTQDDQHRREFELLLRYFANDEQGGSPFEGISRNFVSHQISATQRGATVLQYLLEQLSNQLITQQESSSIISNSEFASTPPRLLFGQTPAYRTSFNVATRRRMDIASLPSTWELMDRDALIDLDFNATPITSYRVLLTKGHVLAKSMINHYGHDRIGTLLEQLLTTYQGQTFKYAELVQIASTAGIDFDEWILPWLEETALPGILVISPDVSELRATDVGEDKYQTTLILHNAESIPGFIRVVWTQDGEGQFLYPWGWGDFTYSEPIFLSGLDSKRIAIQSNVPLTGLWIEPFLSLNRAPLAVSVPKVDKNDSLKSPALPYVAEFEWQPSASVAIVIDDLDPGFSIVTRTPYTDAYTLPYGKSQLLDKRLELDQGLPLASPPEYGKWLRLMSSDSYGYYRRTHTIIAYGEEVSAARFSASLPSTGSWVLELFVPSSALADRRFADSVFGLGLFEKDRLFVNRRADPNSPEEHYRLRISDSNSEWTKQFNIAKAKKGWNEVGIFELGTTDVDVLLSDWAGSDEIMVHADAIRWTPADPD